MFKKTNSSGIVEIKIDAKKYNALQIGKPSLKEYPKKDIVMQLLDSMYTFYKTLAAAYQESTKAGDQEYSIEISRVTLLLTDIFANVDIVKEDYRRYFEYLNRVYNSMRDWARNNTETDGRWDAYECDDFAYLNETLVYLVGNAMLDSELKALEKELCLSVQMQCLAHYQRAIKREVTTLLRVAKINNRYHVHRICRLFLGKGFSNFERAEEILTYPYQVDSLAELESKYSYLEIPLHIAPSEKEQAINDYFMQQRFDDSTVKKREQALRDCHVINVSKS